VKLFFRLDYGKARPADFRCMWRPRGAGFILTSRFVLAPLFPTPSLLIREAQCPGPGAARTATTAASEGSFGSGCGRFAGVAAQRVATPPRGRDVGVRPSCSFRWNGSTSAAPATRTAGTACGLRGTASPRAPTPPAAPAAILLRWPVIGHRMNGFRDLVRKSVLFFAQHVWHAPAGISGPWRDLCRTDEHELLVVQRGHSDAPFGILAHPLFVSLQAAHSLVIEVFDAVGHQLETLE
jgi:hypothetical protein